MKTYARHKWVKGKILKDFPLNPKAALFYLRDEEKYLVTEDGWIYLRDTAEIPQGRLRYPEDFDALG